MALPAEQVESVQVGSAVVSGCFRECHTLRSLPPSETMLCYKRCRSNGGKGRRGRGRAGTEEERQRLEITE